MPDIMDAIMLGLYPFSLSPITLIDISHHAGLTPVTMGGLSLPDPDLISHSQG